MIGKLIVVLALMAKIFQVHGYNEINTYAGVYSTSGTTAGDGGPVTSAKFNAPFASWVSTDGVVYQGEDSGKRIRKISAAGIINAYFGTGVSTLAGNGGAATAATGSPWTVWGDSVGNIYFADNSGSVVRKINSNNIVNAFAGGGALTTESAAATQASFSGVYSAMGDSAGNVYVVCQGQYKIKKISTSLVVTTFAGTGSGAATDSATAAGLGGKATSARIYQPRGAFLDSSNNFYLTSNGGGYIRKISMVTNIITLVAGIPGSQGYAGDMGPATQALLQDGTTNVATDTAGNVYYSSLSYNNLRYVDTNGIIGPYAGKAGTSTSGGYSGDGGAATAALMKGVYGMTCSAGLVYVSELTNNVVRSITVASDPVSIAFAGYTTTEPTLTPTKSPTVRPTVKPTTVAPTVSAAPMASGPTVAPTEAPTVIPTVAPSVLPTVTPTITPTVVPTVAPSAVPSVQPSMMPSVQPSVLPSVQPSIVPTVVPSVAPSVKPTVVPTTQPSVMPSVVTTSPTESPTVSIQPSAAPTVAPSVLPTVMPTVVPSEAPSVAPTVQPSKIPTVVPTLMPTVLPTVAPSAAPSVIPTTQPSVVPTVIPTIVPTVSPSVEPSMPPSAAPTTTAPSAAPTTTTPSTAPTAAPSPASASPTSPTVQPSMVPTMSPSARPSAAPTEAFVDISFDADIYLHNVTATVLGETEQSAVAGAVALTLNVNSSQVTFLSQTLIGSERRLRRLTSFARYQILTSVNVWASTRNFPDATNKNASYLYNKLSTTLTTAVDSNAFSTTVRSVSAQMNAVSTLYVGMVNLTVTDYSVVTPGSGDSQSSSVGVSEGGIAGIVIGAVVFVTLLMAVCCFIIGRSKSRQKVAAGAATH